jgi:hypothetical protein
MTTDMANEDMADVIEERTNRPKQAGNPKK